MADRKPLKVLPDGGGDSTGLGEFVAADTVGIVDGGTGLATVGSNQLLTGNGTSALTSESNLTFDGNALTMSSSSVAGQIFTLTNSGTNSYPTLRFTNDAATWNVYGANGGSGTYPDCFQIQNGSAQLQIATGGDVIIGDGDLVIGTSGHGISFAATSNGGTTTPSELFDDYEEGTWTPSMRYGSSATAYTHTNQEGRYVKIGRLVWISANMNISNADASNSGSDGFQLYGLPFTITNETAAHSRIILHINKFSPGSTALELFAYAIVNTTILQPFLTWNNGTGWSSPTTDMFYRADGAQNVFVTGCYFANA